MDTRVNDKQIIKNVLLEYSKFKPAWGDIEARVIFDDERGGYALM